MTVYQHVMPGLQAQAASTFETGADPVWLTPGGYAA